MISLEWIALLVTVCGTCVSAVFSYKSVRASRIESELNGFIAQSGRYNDLLLELMQTERDILNNPDCKNTPPKARYLAYQIIDILAETHDLQSYQVEVGDTMKNRWKSRRSHLFSRPFFKSVWKDKV